MSFKKIADKTYLGSSFNSNKPIVLLCGFADGTQKYLVKYGDLYEKLGYSVIILESTMIDFLWTPERWTHYKAYQELKKFDLKDVVVHMMSNGGIRSWYCFEQHFGRKLNVKAMVIDSAPTLPPGVFPGTKFFFPTLSTGFAKVVDIVITPFLWAFKLYYHVYPKSQKFYKHADRLFFQMKEVPKLFLYSKGDTVVSSKGIEEAILMIKKNGTEVESVDFETSPHVQHLRYHPDLYERNVREFLARHASSDASL